MYMTHITRSCSFYDTHVRSEVAQAEQRRSQDRVPASTFCSGASFGHVQYTIRDRETMRQTSSGSSRKEMWTKAADYTS